MTLPVRAFVGLGGNVGDVRAAMEAAFTAFAALPGTRLVARSSFYRSAPQDAAGPDYLNAVAELATTEAAAELLRHLQLIEAQHGRDRPYRHAPRTLDLDLLLYGMGSIDSPMLTVPHPRLHQRAFVLRPLIEIAPELAVPGLGSLTELLPTVADQAIDRLPE